MCRAVNDFPHRFDSERRVERVIINFKEGELREIEGSRSINIRKS